MKVRRGIAVYNMRVPLISEIEMNYTENAYGGGSSLARYRSLPPAVPRG